MTTSYTTTNTPAVVFDFGGVIFDWNPYYLFRHFFNDDRRAVELFLEEIRFREWNFQLDIGYPFKQMIDERSREFPQYANLIRAYDDRWMETFGGPIQPTIEVVKKLHQQGRRIYALSNWSLEKFSLIRPRYDFLNCFEQIVISGEEKVGKPDRRMFEAFLARTGLKAHDCLFIDDFGENLRVAKSLGFDTIQFKNAAQLTEEIIRRKLLLQ